MASVKIQPIGPSAIGPNSPSFGTFVAPIDAYRCVKIKTKKTRTATSDDLRGKGLRSPKAPRPHAGAPEFVSDLVLKNCLACVASPTADQHLRARAQANPSSNDEWNSIETCLLAWLLAWLPTWLLACLLAWLLALLLAWLLAWLFA